MSQTHYVFIGFPYKKSKEFESDSSHFGRWIDDGDIMSMDTPLEQIAKEFEESDSGIIETKNVLLLNYFSDEFAQESFLIYDKEKEEWISPFNENNVCKFWNGLGPGEIIADTYNI